MSADCPFQGEISVPLFPLPGVVLLPRAVLPLHIFEPRYRAMMAHALAGEKRIAMALLRHGWQKCPTPPIDPVVCVGLIRQHEKLPDGRYNLLLQGWARAAIVDEHRVEAGYRLARLKPIPQIIATEPAVAPHREAIAHLIKSGNIRGSDLARQILQLIDSPLRTAELADVLAFSLLEDPELRQQILADPDEARRIVTVTSALQPVLCPPKSGDCHRYFNDPETG